MTDVLVSAQHARRVQQEEGLEYIRDDLMPRADLSVDSLTTWVATAPHFSVEAEAVCTALRKRDGDTIVVSDEVGLGVHPSTEVGNRFRDALGLLNQQVAAVADDVLLVVAGRTLRLT